MPLIVYKKLAKSIALRSNQLGDAVDSATLETAYRDTDLDLIMQGVEVPYTALRHDIIVAEKEIVAMIGNSENAQLRAALLGDADVISGDDVPHTDDATKPFFGKWDGLFDNQDNALQLMDKQVVLRRIANAGDFYRLDLNGWCIEGTRVYFQCSSQTATLRGVSWKQADAETEYDLETELGTSVLPDQCEALWRNLVLASLAQEGFFQNEAGFYARLAAQSAENIGLIMVPAKLPDVVSTNTENQNAQSENR